MRTELVAACHSKGPEKNDAKSWTSSLLGWGHRRQAIARRLVRRNKTQNNQSWRSSLQEKRPSKPGWTPWPVGWWQATQDTQDSPENELKTKNWTTFGARARKAISKHSEEEMRRCNSAIFFARAERPFMQEMHRSACAVFERSANQQTQHQHKPTPNKNRPGKKAGDSWMYVQGETGVRHKSGIELSLADATAQRTKAA